MYIYLYIYMYTYIVSGHSPESSIYIYIFHLILFFANTQKMFANTPKILCCATALERLQCNVPVSVSDYSTCS